MKKILLLITVMIASLGAVAKSDSIDVMIIDPDKMGLPKGKIEQLVKRKVEFINRFFERNNLLISLNIKGIDYIKSPLKFGNIHMEATSLSISASGLPPIFDGVAFSDKSLEKKVSSWIKKDIDNYKVIFIPMTEQSLECGMSFSSSEMSFSLMHLSETGQCASDWILAHELGHQDGLVHEGEASSLSGGKCGAKPSLMHSGLTGDREYLFGNESGCSVHKIDRESTPYDMYKERSDANKKVAYKVIEQYKAPVSPIVISETYEINNTDVLGKLVIYNPTNKTMRGQLRLVDFNAPVNIKNKSLLIPDEISAKPSGVTYHEVKTTRDKLLGYGSKMKISAEFDWH